MDNKPFNLFFSFRARIVFFVVLILFVTILALDLINRHSEQRITQLVADHIRDMSLAVDLAQTSFPSGQYLYDLIPLNGQLRVGLEDNNIIHRILVADAEGKVIDSSERNDIDKTIQQTLGDLTPTPYPNRLRAAITDAREPDRALTYPVETEKGNRRVVIIISPHRLAEIVAKEALGRWIGITLLSLSLIFTVAVASWRFTRPIRELAHAAQRVSSGDFDFNMRIERRDEIGRLAQTFNVMLAGLRDAREMEVKLQRAERSAMTGRIAAGIAHEIRNPLSFINLTIDFLRDKFSPAADAARDDYTRLLDNVKEEIARLNGMVNDFLSFGRPARLKLRQLDARAVADEVAALVRAKAEQQNVQVHVREDGVGEFNMCLQADFEQIKTCFSNIAINAVQAMPDGGELAITLRPHQNNIRVEFADTGLGIQPDALGQIFEPYFSTKETGIGLGLALTKKLIEDHGGQILASSEVGVGTTFTVILPRDPDTGEKPASLSQIALNRMDSRWPTKSPMGSTSGF